MKELKLEHLAPYLPYDLKITHVGQPEVMYTMNTIINSCFIGDHSNLDDEYNTKLYLIKPILRPLSDLTKEIEVNGKKFVPAEYLWMCDIAEWKSFEIYGKIPDYWDACMKVIPYETEYRTMQKLFKMHFDVFGLIEKGLAIDINDVKNVVD